MPICFLLIDVVPLKQIVFSIFTDCQKPVYLHAIKTIIISAVIELSKPLASRTSLVLSAPSPSTSISMSVLLPLFFVGVFKFLFTVHLCCGAIASDIILLAGFLRRQ